MSIYSFSSFSPVREVVFRFANDRPPVGLMTAGEGINADQVSIIHRAIASKGWQSVPVSVDGKDYMQVSGFQKPEDLLGFLAGYQFVEGKPHFTEEPDDNPRRTSMEWAQSIGLKGAGLLNLVGDISLLGSGLQSGRNKEITAGAFYTAGAAVLTRYANVKTEHHLRQVIENTAEFLKTQSGSLPEDCGLFTLLKEKREGVVHNVENFLYRYPSEVMLGAYTFGAFTMLQSGMRQKNPWDIAYGANSVAVKAASLLIPEKHKTEEEKAGATTVGKFVNWVQEKPLRVFGFGSMVSDVLLGISAMREYRNDPKQRSYIFKFITSGTYILADALIAISHKNHANGEGKFDTEEQRRVVALVAEAVSREPQEMREPLVQQVAGFLATQPEVQGNAHAIADAIHEQLEHLRNNPWARRSSAGSLPPALT